MPRGGGGRRERLLSWLHVQCSVWRGARSTTLRPWPEPRRAVGRSTDWASQASPVVLSFIKHVWVANCESLHIGKCLCFVLPCDWRVFWEFWLQPLFPTEWGLWCPELLGSTRPVSCFFLWGTVVRFQRDSFMRRLVQFYPCMSGKYSLFQTVSGLFWVVGLGLCSAQECPSFALLSSLHSPAEPILWNFYRSGVGAP